MYVCMYVGYKDINSREIAFLGRVAISGSRSRLLISPFTGVTRVGSPTGRKGEGRWPAGPRYCSQPMPGPHRSIDIAGDGAPKTSQNGRGRRLQGERNRESIMADQPPDGGRGNRRPPPSDATGQLVDVAGGWAHKTAGSGWVYGTVVHLSKRRHGVRQRDAIANRPPDAGYGRPQDRSRTWQDDRPKSQCSSCSL